MMKRRTLQACCLRHSIKKGMFSVHGNLDLLKVGRGESSPPPLLLPPWLRACISSMMLTHCLKLLFYLFSLCKYYDLLVSGTAQS